MAIMVQVCKEHGREAMKQCSWCSRPMCSGCIEAAQGRKLCVACATKLSRDMQYVRKDGYRKGIRNKDDNLTQEQIEEARHLLIEKRRPKVSRIVNEPTGVKNVTGPRRAEPHKQVEEEWPELLD